MANSQSKDESTVGCISNQRSALRAGVGMPQIDVCNPSPHQDTARCGSHQLGRRHRIVVDLSSKDRVETCILGLARYHLDFASAPTNPWDNGQCESFCHRVLLDQQTQHGAKSQPCF